MNSYMFSIYVMLFGITISGISQIVLKQAANKEHKNLITQYLNIKVAIGYGLLFIATLCTVIGYKQIPLSMAPIWDALSQILILILSYAVLKENITKRKVFGVIIIVIGILIFLF